MRILVWHVHGSWMTALVQGRHDYLVPVVPGRGPTGGAAPRPGTGRRRCVEVTPEQLRPASTGPMSCCCNGRSDAELLQRLERAAGRRRRPGDPRRAQHARAATCATGATRSPTETRYPDRARDALQRAMWDNGRAPVHVIEHGVLDPGHPGPASSPACRCASTSRYAEGGSPAWTSPRGSPGTSRSTSTAWAGGRAARAPARRSPAASTPTCRSTSCTPAWPTTGPTCTPTAGPAWGCRCSRR